MMNSILMRVFYSPNIGRYPEVEIQSLKYSPIIMGIVFAGGGFPQCFLPISQQVSQCIEILRQKEEKQARHTMEMQHLLEHAEPNYTVMKAGNRDLWLDRRKEALGRR